MRLTRLGSASIVKLRGLWSDVGLGSKMTVLVITGTLALIGFFAYLGTVALNETIQHSLQERVVLAQTTARHIDYVLASIRDRLTEAASGDTWSNPERNAVSLEQAFRQLDFSASQVFLLEPNGYAVAAYPPITASVSFNDFASVAAVLNGQPFAISRYRRPLGPLEPTTVAAAPLLDAAGHVTGALVISINLTNPNIRTFTNPIGLGESGYMDLVDLRGVILVSTRPERIGSESDHGDTLAQMIQEQRGTVSACHDCHDSAPSSPPRREVIAFAPLEQAQWGVTVRQSEDEVFAATHQLQVRIFALMLVVIAGALVLVYLTTRSVIVPVQALTTATQRIAAGDLDTPLAMGGRDEIGTLARSFDAMREHLKQSMDEISSWNRELDERVKDGMSKYQAALEQKEQLRTELLHRVIAAQEEERKRISRELHDETCQQLTGLAFAVDNAAEASTLAEARTLLENIHGLTETTLGGVHRIIYDLRPTLLDNLGLIPALRWYAETRLTSPGVKFVFRESGEPHRLPPFVETAIFRVVQEAINNIGLHSHARHADFLFELTAQGAEVRITDDGVGFDLAKRMDTPDGKRGLGLMGMEERMRAIGGEFHLQSEPSQGTAIRLVVPIPDAAAVQKEEAERG